MWQRLTLISTLSLFIISCGKDNQPNSSGSNEKPKRSPGFFGKVCYPNECLPTVSQLEVDASNDYNYPDENNFPNEAMRPQYRKPYAYIDLINELESTELSKNFQLYELMSANKGALGIFSPIALFNIQKIRDELDQPIFITSAFRSPGYNRAIPGASTWSRHTYGDAIDFFAIDRSLEELKELCLKYGASFFQIYRSHIHCDWRMEPLDTAFYPPTLPPTQLISTFKALSEMTDIHMHFDGHRLHFHVDHLEAEDGGELLYEWTIQTPDGLIHRFDEASIYLPAGRGTYKTYVKVGGSVESQKNFVW